MGIYFNSSIMKSCLFSLLAGFLSLILSIFFWLILFTTPILAQSPNSSKKIGCQSGDCESGVGKYTYFSVDEFTKQQEEQDPKLNKKKKKSKKIKSLMFDSYYVGSFQYARRSGRGKMIYSDGSRYKGKWENDEREGKGTMTYTNGSIYEGSWENDEREGIGKMTYADDSVYEGSWENDAREGEGTMTYADGSEYRGPWKNGKREGEGIMIDVKGKAYRGLWENGREIANLGDPSKKIKTKVKGIFHLYYSNATLSSIVSDDGSNAKKENTVLAFTFDFIFKKRHALAMDYYSFARGNSTEFIDTASSDIDFHPSTTINAGTSFKTDIDIIGISGPFLGYRYYFSAPTLNLLST